MDEEMEEDMNWDEQIYKENLLDRAMSECDIQQIEFLLPLISGDVSEHLIEGIKCSIESANWQCLRVCLRFVDSLQYMNRIDPDCMKNVDCIKVFLDTTNFNVNVEISGYLPLIAAVEYGTEECVRLLLDAGAHVNTVLSPLIYCVDTSGVKIGKVSLLLEAGCEIDDSLDNYNTVRLLLEDAADTHDGSSINFLARSIKFRQPLMALAVKGDVELLKGVLEQDVDVNAVGCHCLTALMLTAITGDRACMSVLLDNQAKMDVQDKRGYTALMFASLLGRLECVTLLLHHGADVNIYNSRKENALMLSARGGQNGCLKILVGVRTSEGPLVDLCNSENMTLMDMAARSGNVDCVKTLCQAHVLIGSNVLEYAAQSGNCQCLEYCLENYTDTTSLKEMLKSTMEYIASEGLLECLKVVLTYAEKTMAENSDLETVFCSAVYSAVYAAIDSDRIDCLNVLLSHIVDRKLEERWRESDGGGTPLRHAVYRHHKRSVRALLKFGLWPNVDDRDAYSPLMEAMTTERASIFEDILIAELKKEDSQLKKEEQIIKLFEKSCMSQNALIILLKHFGLRWHWYTRCQFDELMSERVLNRALVTNCVKLPPVQEIDLRHRPNKIRELMAWRRSKGTPFQWALWKGDIASVRYLLANHYLTIRDVQPQLWDRRLYRDFWVERGFRDVYESDEEDYKLRDVTSIKEQLSSKTCPLQLLAYFVISDCLHTNENRRQQIRQLPLPEYFKRKLSFDTNMSKLCILQWGNIGGEEGQECGSRRPTDVWDLLSFSKGTYPENSPLVPCPCQNCDLSGLTVENSKLPKCLPTDN